MVKVLCYTQGSAPKEVEVEKGAPVTKIFEETGLDTKGARAILLTSGGRVTLRDNEPLDISDDACRAFVVVPSSKSDKQDLPQSVPDFKMDKKMIERFTEHLKGKEVASDRTGALTQIRSQDSQELFDEVAPLLIKAAKALQVRAGTRQPEQEPSGEEGEEQQPQEEEPYDPMKEVDPNALSAVMEAGFEPHHCIRALLASNMQPEQAVMYLLEHAGDPALDRPITPPPKPVKNKHGRKFQPDAQAFRNLKELGFAEEDALAALQLTRNNFNQAMELLINNEDVKAMLQKSSRSVRHLMRELLENAVVWQALFKQEFVTALEMLLDDMQNMERVEVYGRVGRAIRVVLKGVQDHSPEVYAEDEQAQFEDDGLDYRVFQPRREGPDVFSQLLDRLLVAGHDSFMRHLTGHGEEEEEEGEEEEEEEQRDDDTDAEDEADLAVLLADAAAEGGEEDQDDQEFDD